MKNPHIFSWALILLIILPLSTLQAQEDGQYRRIVALKNISGKMGPRAFTLVIAVEINDFDKIEEGILSPNHSIDFEALKAKSPELVAARANKKYPHAWFMDEAEHFRDESGEAWLETTYYWADHPESEGISPDLALREVARKQLIPFVVEMDENGLVKEAYFREGEAMIDRDRVIHDNYEEDDSMQLDDEVLYELDGGR